MTQESSQVKPIITMVCVRKTFLKNGKLGFVFKEVKPQGTLGDERIYSEKDLKHVRVGAVYQVEVDPENQRSIYTHTLRWLALWRDSEQAAVWQIAADAFDTEAAARKQEKRETSRELFLEMLAPLRKQYWKTNPATRLAIEVRVLAYLRRVPLHEESS